MASLAASRTDQSRSCAGWAGHFVGGGGKKSHESKDESEANDEKAAAATQDVEEADGEKATPPWQMTTRTANLTTSDFDGVVLLGRNAVVPLNDLIDSSVC